MLVVGLHTLKFNLQNFVYNNAIQTDPMTAVVSITREHVDNLSRSNARITKVDTSPTQMERSTAAKLRNEVQHLKLDMFRLMVGD